MCWDRLLSVSAINFGLAGIINTGTIALDMLLCVCAAPLWPFMQRHGLPA